MSGPTVRATRARPVGGPSALVVSVFTSSDNCVHGAQTHATTSDIVALATWLEIAGKTDQGQRAPPQDQGIETPWDW